MQKFGEIIVILEKGIKHLFFMLSKQEKELLLSHFTLEELKLCHCPKHSMRKNNTIL